MTESDADFEYERRTGNKHHPALQIPGHRRSNFPFAPLMTGFGLVAAVIALTGLGSSKEVLPYSSFPSMKNIMPFRDESRDSIDRLIQDLNQLRRQFAGEPTRYSHISQMMDDIRRIPSHWGAEIRDSSQMEFLRHLPERIGSELREGGRYIREIPGRIGSEIQGSLPKGYLEKLPSSLVTPPHGTTKIGKRKIPLETATRLGKSGTTALAILEKLGQPDDRLTDSIMTMPGPYIEEGVPTIRSQPDHHGAYYLVYNTDSPHNQFWYKISAHNDKVLRSGWHTSH